MHKTLDHIVGFNLPFTFAYWKPGGEKRLVRLALQLTKLYLSILSFVYSLHNSPSVPFPPTPTVPTPSVPIPPTPTVPTPSVPFPPTPTVPTPSVPFPPTPTVPTPSVPILYTLPLWTKPKAWCDMPFSLSISYTGFLSVLPSSIPSSSSSYLFLFIPPSSLTSLSPLPFPALPFSLFSPFPHPRFTCRDGCDLGDYVSEEGVCEDCHPLCEQCVGPGTRNCTSCKDTRWCPVNLLCYK